MNTVNANSTPTMKYPRVKVSNEGILRVLVAKIPRPTEQTQIL